MSVSLVISNYIPVQRESTPYYGGGWVSSSRIREKMRTALQHVCTDVGIAGSQLRMRFARLPWNARKSDDENVRIDVRGLALKSAGVRDTAERIAEAAAQSYSQHRFRCGSRRQFTTMAYFADIPVEVCIHSQADDVDPVVACKVSDEHNDRGSTIRGAAIPRTISIGGRRGGWPRIH